MKEKTAAERAKKKLKELMQKAGVPEEQLKAFDDHVIHESDFVKSLEVEGILLTLYSEKIPVKTKLCKKCEQPFATNYMYVAYCSDHCRARSLEEIGIQWNPHKQPEERWGSEVYRNQIPIVISPEALANLRRLVQEIEAAETQKEIDASANLEPREQTQTQIALGQALSQAYDFPGMKAKADEELRQFDEGTHLLDRLGESQKSVFPIHANGKTTPQVKSVENTSPQPSLPEHTVPESQEVKSVFRFL